jgi:hypothetical protein
LSIFNQHDARCVVRLTSIRRATGFVRRVLIAFIAAILIWTLIVMILEDAFIYFPTRYPDGIYEDARFIPGLKDCWIITDDNVKIHGWFAPSDSAIATLVISHGNAGNISHRIDLIRRLQTTGFNVLMYDYRGYGRSEGSPSEEGLYSDGRAAFDHALKLPGVRPDRVILWGTSLGGPVAVDVAVNRRPAGVILESTFSSAKDVARSAYPFLPVAYVLRSKYDAIDKIGRIGVPLFQMHGDRDGIIPFKLGKRLFEAANEPKEFYVIEGADHNDTYFVGGQEYLDKVKAFAQRIAGVLGNAR